MRQEEKSFSLVISLTLDAMSREIEKNVEEESGWWDNDYLCWREDVIKKDREN